MSWLSHQAWIGSTWGSPGLSSHSEPKDAATCGFQFRESDLWPEWLEIVYLALCSSGNWTSQNLLVFMTSIWKRDKCLFHPFSENFEARVPSSYQVDSLAQEQLQAPCLGSACGGLQWFQEAILPWETCFYYHSFDLLLEGCRTWDRD